MVEVKFHKQWRGHDPGTVVELTDERAKELIRLDYCKATADLGKKRGRPKKAEEPKAEESKIEEPKAEPAKKSFFSRPEIDAGPSTGTEP